MEVTTTTFVRFDALEQRTLNWVESSIRIAFPTIDIEQARLAGDERKIKDAKRAWPARQLQNVCSTDGEWDAKTIRAAWDQLVRLEAVLEEQADRSYWEGLAPGGELPGSREMCRVLAQERARQLQNAREALKVLDAARLEVE